MAAQFKDRTGEIHMTNEGYPIKIIKCVSWEDNTIQFENGYIVEHLQYAGIKRGAVSNPYHKSVHGKGYVGEGNYKKHIGKKQTKYYIRWSRVLERCEGSELIPYKNSTICDEWECFQVFAKWFEENFKDHMDSSWHLDKDILFKGNKHYSPETCEFVPQEINKLFTKRQNKRGSCPIGVTYNKRLKKYIATLSTGKIRETHLGTFNTPKEAFQAYKEAKEAWIKEVANKWRGEITERCYFAMMNYKVEITD